MKLDPTDIVIYLIIVCITIVSVAEIVFSAPTDQCQKESK